MTNTDNYYTSIMTGLDESPEYSRGNLPGVKKRLVTVTPVPVYSAENIKLIRNSLRLTQMVFAEALGVSIKTVEAWESGRNHPQWTGLPVSTAPGNG